MKKRRTLIIALLLVAALALGIGYAAVEGKLYIHGKVTTAAQPFDVVFTEYQTEGTPSEGVVGAIVDQLPAQTVKFTVTGMDEAGDTITGKFTIKNNNEFTMYLSDPTIVYTNDANGTDVAGNGMFTVTTSWGTAGTTLATGAETEVFVTVTMNKGMDAEVNEEFTLTINATSTNPNP
ncbi:MAG: hypothetical protein E7653_02190 [Ruminococcaceae bacterium]|nr:hypothetical protein [Oscillospiraceae bacterium]